MPLAGGLLGTVAMWHVLADAVLEFGTTLAEAATAVVTFGAFAVPTFQHIYVQMQNVWTASNALNGAIYPLQGGFSRLSQAIRPEVYQLFGEALVAVNGHMGEFQQVAADAGRVLDQLGGRFVAAINTGGAFAQFLRDSTRSLSEWGTILSNVGGILGNFLHVLPGYANLLTHALVDVTGALEAITSSGFVQTMLNIGLAMHGAILWGGLLVTGLLALRGPLATLGSGLLTAIGWFRTLTTSMGAVEGAGAKLSVLWSALGSPWGAAIAVGVGALAALIIALTSAKDAAQQFNSTIQQTIQQTPLVQLAQTLGASAAQYSVRLSQAADQVTVSMQHQSAAVQAYGSGLEQLNPSVQSAVENQRQLQAGSDQVSQQAHLLNARVKALAGQFGGTAAAWGLMNQAGITSQQILSTNNQTWQAAKVQILAVADANRAMALGAGRNAAAMNALNYAGDTTNNVLGSLDADMQKVVGGMDSITNVVLGGEQALTGFFQALNQTKIDSQAAKTSLTGLNTSSLTYASDVWSTLLPGMQKTIDAMQMQLATTPQLTTATATMAQQILQAAPANSAVEAAVISLINNALGPGTVSFQNYNQWIAKNATSLQGLQGIIGQTTVQASTLANTIGSDLNASFASNLLNVTGAQKALSQYTSDLYNNAQNTAAGQADRARLISDLENAGLSAQQATTYVSGLSTALGKVVSPPPVTIVVNGVISGNPYAISIAQQLGAFSTSGGLSSGKVASIIAHGATGGLVHGPGTSTSDSVHARLSRGEYVVRAAAVQHYGQQLFDSLNARRFAAGGPATPGIVPAVLQATLSGGGGQGAIHLHTRNTMSLSGRRILDQQRSEQLKYSRRNPGSDWSLRARTGSPR